MPRAMQLTLGLENKPGQAAKLGAALKRAKVNILAVSVVDSADVCAVRLVTDNNAKAKQALTTAGLKTTQQAVLTLTLCNEPGAFADAAEKLAKAGVNIDYFYGSVTKTAMEGLIVFGVDDLDKALKVV